MVGGVVSTVRMSSFVLLAISRLAPSLQLP